MLRPVDWFQGSSGPPRFTPRVSQLRQEECVDVAGREAAHERDTFSAMQMSQSWEDLRLVPEEPKVCGGSLIYCNKTFKLKKSVSVPVTIVGDNILS